jgi:hypothetical protein
MFRRLKLPFGGDWRSLICVDPSNSFFLDFPCHGPATLAHAAFVGARIRAECGGPIVSAWVATAPRE